MYPFIKQENKTLILIGAVESFMLYFSDLTWEIAADF